jgi:protoporphyrinogen oxidase
MKRRDFLLQTSSACTYISLSGLFSSKNDFYFEEPFRGDRNNYLDDAAFQTAQYKKLLSTLSPIDRSYDKRTYPKAFSGDEAPEVRHRILWNKGDYINTHGGIPASSAAHPVIVIGGGISGLTASYLLKEFNPVILEQASRFGGNSKGQSWNSVLYSLGVAYFIKPDRGSNIDTLFRELGLHREWSIKSGSDNTIINKKIKKNFWKGDLDKSNRTQFQKLSNYFTSVNNAESGFVYPDIPFTDNDAKSLVLQLDTISFKDHVATVAGGMISPFIESVIEQYCWSSFNASASEVSAASGLNFYAAEFGEIAVLPGGNSRVAEKLCEKLLMMLPPNSLRPNSIVINVKVKDTGVEVTYIDASEQLKTITAKVCVMACPKFVVSRILEDIEEERLSAIKRLKYRGYLVANVILKKKPIQQFYDMYMLGDGKLSSATIQEAAKKRRVTDVILANFSSPSRFGTVLSLYRGIPYEEGRAELYAEKSYEQYLKEFLNQVYDEILPALGYKTKDIQELRISRWGHPIPVAQAGLIADGVVNTLRSTFKERVFFIEQDNWALPGIETCIEENYLLTPGIKALLKK